MSGDRRLSFETQLKIEFLSPNSDSEKYWKLQKNIYAIV